jgi:pimeloyl-ACP methyl ester carboxylesterase
VIPLRDAASSEAQGSSLAATRARARVDGAGEGGERWSAAEAASSEAQGSSLAATRARVWAEEAGQAEAPLIVLVHGTMDRSAGLLKLSRRLDDRFRVLRYDRRGYGRSTPHVGPFGMAEQVGDLVDLLEGRRAVVFGHSYGGDVALALTDRHPELVRAVGVYEVPLPWLDWWPASAAGAQALQDGLLPADAAERFVRRLIGDERWSRLPAGTRAARRREGPAMVAELDDLGNAGDDPPWRPERITVPAVAMCGSAGQPHHARSTAHIATVLPDCRRVVIDGARHFGPNTHPDAVATVVGDLVSRAAT